MADYTTGDWFSQDKTRPFSLDGPVLAESNLKMAFLGSVPGRYGRGQSRIHPQELWTLPAMR